MSGSRKEVRVYYRRTKMQGTSWRDWASLPAGLLEKIFESLKVADLQSARETCAKWREQVAGSGIPMSSWTDTIEGILRNLHRLDGIAYADVEEMKQFLVREGLMEARRNNDV